MSHATYSLCSGLFVFSDAQEEACGLIALSPLSFWAVVSPYLPFPLRAFCVLLEHAPKHCFPTCGDFAIVLAFAQAISLCFLSLFVLCCCVWWIFADLAKQWRKTRGRFLRSEKTIFPFFYLFSAPFFCSFFLFFNKSRCEVLGAQRCARQHKTLLQWSSGFNVLYERGLFHLVGLCAHYLVCRP